MKNLILVLTAIPFISFAQSVDVKDVASGEESTTIEISRGASTKDGYKIVEVSDEIMGDTHLMVKDARKNWKTACEDWKKETKSLNTDNKIISMSCGKMTCSQGGAAGTTEHTCQSQTKLVVKTKVR